MNQNGVINKKDSRAIELKYSGVSYTEIAMAIGVEHSTVKAWFMRSGRLYKPYMEYAIEQSAERKSVAKQLYTMCLEKAVKTMIGLLDSKDERVQLATAREIIRREMLDDTVSPHELQELRVVDMMEAIKRSRKEAGLSDAESLLPQKQIQGVAI